MILQERDGALLLFRQTDHALLSGAFANVWGNDRIPVPVRRESTVVAAARHDDGWFEWELAPRLAPNGGPVDFIHIPVEQHVALYKRGIDLVESEDDYAGLIASLHGERLYTRPFFPGMDPRIQNLKNTDLELATAYVEGERKRQEQLLGRIGGHGTQVEADEGWRQLQVWDRLSLLVCMQQLDENAERKMPPIASVEGDVEIVARGTGDGDLLLDPYPFREEGTVFDIAGVQTPVTRWDDEPTFRREFRTAERITLRFKAVPA
ncbi:MAG: DUF3891 family protein [Actinomycetota bacterium]